MKSRLILSLGAAALALVLAGCSDSGDQKAAEAPKTSVPGSTTPATPSPETTGSTTALPRSEGTVDMAKLLEPGPLPDMSIGKADAPVTIVEYASMTCPHCAHFHETTLPAFKEKYVDTGKVRLIFREFPFDPRAEAGFMLARCSGDRYMAMVDVLFRQQRNWAASENAKDALLQISKLAGFTQETFEKCLTDQKLLDDIRAVREKGDKDFGVNATPTFFINGQKYAGALTLDEISALVDATN